MIFLLLGPSGLLFDRFHAEFIGFCPFRGKNVFTLDVAVNKLDDGIIVIEVHHDHRHGIQTGKLTGSLTAMTGNQLIAAIRLRSGNGWNQNAVFLHALNEFQHGRVVPDTEGIVRVWMELVDGNAVDTAYRFRGLTRDNARLLSQKCI